MTGPILERAQQLIQLKRYAEAEKELKQVLAADPNQAQALALFAICQSEQGNTKEASSLIQQAVAKEPDNDYFLYLYAFFLFREEKYKEAEKLISNAIAFQPHNAEYFGLLALVKMSQREWNAALETANRGLAVDPDNLTCLNARSTSLFKVDKKEEAYITIEKALSKDPENEVTHTNLGWGLLEKGDHRRALEHFREALKIDPDYSFAKAGLVEGLKARYWFYRLFLKYAFWVGNMKAKGQWALILGMYFGVRILRSVANSSPELAVFLTPIIYLYFAFALSTWVITPLSNLFLRLNVYGRYALTEEETESSNFVGISVLIALFGGLMMIFSNDVLYEILLVFGVTMMIPLSSMFNPKKKESKRILIGYTVALALIGLVVIAGQILETEIPMLPVIYLFGIVVYQWVANYFIIR
jgi:tetratricopeptide (TPR) repeat protein